MSKSPVSLHPYFKVHPGQIDAAKAVMAQFVKKTTTEEKVLNYEFTVNGDEVFCREAYADADGVMAHLANIAPEFEQMLKVADVTRVELHGPAEEIDKLRPQLAHLNPAWFVRECGI